MHACIDNLSPEALRQGKLVHLFVVSIVVSVVVFIAFILFLLLCTFLPLGHSLSCIGFLIGSLSFCEIKSAAQQHTGIKLENYASCSSR